MRAAQAAVNAEPQEPVPGAVRTDPIADFQVSPGQAPSATQGKARREPIDMQSRRLARQVPASRPTRTWDADLNAATAKETTPMPVREYMGGDQV